MKRQSVQFVEHKSSSLRTSGAQNEALNDLFTTFWTETGPGFDNRTTSLAVKLVFPLSSFMTLKRSFGFAAKLMKPETRLRRLLMQQHTKNAVLKCKFGFSYLKQLMFYKNNTFELLGFRAIIGKRDKVSIDEIARVDLLLSASDPDEHNQHLLTKMFLRDSIELHTEHFKRHCCRQREWKIRYHAYKSPSLQHAHSKTVYPMSTTISNGVKSLCIVKYISRQA